MNFFTFGFFIFFTLVLILNWFLKRWPLFWRLWLLFSSYIFYLFLDIHFLVILFATSIFNFFTAYLIYKNSFSRSKPMLILAIIGNIYVLGLFKYYDFFRSSAELLLEKIGILVTFPLVEIILPIGLSFYIFRTISYNIDVYSKKIVPAPFVNFLVYVAFFPQLLSGPIMRAKDFLTQLKDGGARKIENLNENVTLILLGLFKKLVISSYLVLNLTFDVFAIPESFASPVIVLTIFAYSLVIYFDFSAYSDLAIGFSGLMGFKSPINFNTPYLASNIKEFWRRWHMSLSSWIRDYVYIPLGGNRKGRKRKYFNLIVAMTLIGFWHGPKMHFIFWGFLHGLALAGTHYYKDRKLNRQDYKKENISFLTRKNLNKKNSIAKKALCCFSTFVFVSFSWIFFRIEGKENIFIFIKSIFNFGKTIEPFKLYILVVMIIGFLLFLFEKEVIKTMVKIQDKLSLVFWLLFIIATLILIFKLSPDTVPSFIYFNF